jgi:hypothetical protein
MLRDVPQERDPLPHTPAPQSWTDRAKGTAEQASRRAPERAPGSAYWLIARNKNSRLEVGGSRHRPRRRGGGDAGVQPRRGGRVVPQALGGRGWWLAGQGEQCRGTHLGALRALRERGAGGPRPFAGDAPGEDSRACEPEQETLRRPGVDKEQRPHEKSLH